MYSDLKVSQSKDSSKTVLRCDQSHLPIYVDNVLIFNIHFDTSKKASIVKPKNTKNRKW